MAALIQINGQPSKTKKTPNIAWQAAVEIAHSRGATLRLKTNRAFAAGAARLFDDQNSVAAENGADQSDQAESQQDPMQPLGTRA